MDGEVPPTTGCYKQYEHSIGNKIPQTADNFQVRIYVKQMGTSLS